MVEQEKDEAFGMMVGSLVEKTETRRKDGQLALESWTSEREVIGGSIPMTRIALSSPVLRCGSPDSTPSRQFRIASPHP